MDDISHVYETELRQFFDELPPESNDSQKWFFYFFLAKDKLQLIPLAIALEDEGLKEIEQYSELDEDSQVELHYLKVESEKVFTADSILSFMKKIESVAMEYHAFFDGFEYCPK